MPLSEKFISQADWIPGFWNFIGTLNREDLIAELVQNDLDQEATRTEISFGKDGLVSLGNGSPVDDSGWKRLRFIQGAGQLVPAKKGKIGVKNHGLKTAFTIGDTLHLSSGGFRITQTLFAAGTDSFPVPGASERRQPDPSSPGHGCRIETLYRRADLRPPVGEKITLGKPSDEDLEKLFLDACMTIPHQFIGLVSPQGLRRYEIAIGHWKLGSALFKFSCGRVTKLKKGTISFRRSCQVTGNLTGRGLPRSIREGVAQRNILIDRELSERLPGFFRRGPRRCFVEVAWTTDDAGKPTWGKGHYRYPIGYPAESAHAATDYGASFSGPFVSTAERHAAMPTDPSNDFVRLECLNLMVDVVADYLIPRWSDVGLRPLLPGVEGVPDEKKLQHVLGLLVSRNALPTLSHSEAVSAVTKKKVPPRPSGGRTRVEPTGHHYKFIIPSFTWDSAVSAELVLLSPQKERILHPAVDARILDNLGEGVEGWTKTFITYDERDVRARIVGDGNDWFPHDTTDELSPCLREVDVAEALLNVTDEALRREKWKSEQELELLSALALPDTTCSLQPFANLRSSVKVPPDLPTLDVPPVIHSRLAKHCIFKRQKWHVARFDIGTFLADPAVVKAEENERFKLWQWIRSNTSILKKNELQQLPKLPIWPAAGGTGMWPLNELCEPRSKELTRVLGDFLKRPHQDVLKSGLVQAKGRGSFALRRSPVREEVLSWINDRLSAIPSGTASAEQKKCLARLEKDLISLSKDSPVAKTLRDLAIALPALAADGTITPRSSLVRSEHVQRLSLPPRFVIADTGRLNKVLDELCPALSIPKREMVLAALVEDGTNFNALQARLQYLRDAGEDGRVVSDLPIVPVDGKALTPGSLAFKGKHGEYWGRWKKRISADGFSQDDQLRLHWAGVTPATPRSSSFETVRDFFRWLSTQEASVVQEHIASVIRHIHHLGRGKNWADFFYEEPCLPFQRGAKIRLATVREAQGRSFFVPDHPLLAAELVKDPTGQWIAIDRIKEVGEPITEVLRGIGVRSLREAARSPAAVIGGILREPAPEQLQKKVVALRDIGFRRSFSKKLAEMGIPRGDVREDWMQRIEEVANLVLSDTVTATYSLGGRKYSLSAGAGFDATTRTVFLCREAIPLASIMLEMLAEQRVFKATAPPINFLALERALQMTITETSFGRPQGEAEDSDSCEGGQGGEPGQGEAAHGHSPFEPDPKKNTPDPQPLGSLKGTTQNDRQRRKKNSRGGGKQPLPPVDERHKNQLKDSEYACHCQACLAVSEPAQLAPIGSYVQYAEIRRQIIEGHHADARDGGGPDHAGNLILLCKFHHANFGRRLSRKAITEALKGATGACRTFSAADLPKVVTGKIARVRIADTEEVFPLFFSDNHAKFWNSQK
jgi:hypothetical protein